MTENDLRFLYLLAERNEVLEELLKNVKNEFKKINNEINYEKNISKLMGKSENIKKCIKLSQEFENDINVLEKMKIREEYNPELVNLENRELKHYYLFEELDFDKVDIDILRIKEKYYKVKDIDEIIITIIKTIEENNYFLNYVNNYPENVLIFTSENFKLGDIPFNIFNEQLYINHELNSNLKIKSLLGLIGRKFNYKYDDFSIITIKKPIRKDNGLTLKEKAWTGKRPESFIFRNQKLEVDSWIDLFVKTLYVLRKDILSNRLYQGEYITKDKKNFMHLSPKNLYRARKISLNNNISVYVRGNYSAQAIRKNIIFLLDYFNFSKSDFYINLID